MIDHTIISASWQLSPILTSWTPPTGTIHQTLLLTTRQGSYALRAYRYRDDERWKIASEHALIAFVKTRGIPALAPVPLENGETILAYDNHYYALFPFAKGVEISRDELTLREAAAMGEFLAQLHKVLQEYPPEKVPIRLFNVDREETLTKIAGLEEAINARSALSDEDRHVLQRLAQRRSWLLSQPAIDLQEEPSASRQVIHGDYQETNLFFADGKVSAVIDWDQAYVASREWEIVRTLHYAMRLKATACQTFLEAYRQILPVSMTNLHRAALDYSRMRDNDIWHYEEIYLKGNQRVRAFLRFDGDFVPFIKKWEKLEISF